MGETIRIQVEGGEMPAYVARPAAAKAPAVFCPVPYPHLTRRPN